MIIPIPFTIVAIQTASFVATTIVHSQYAVIFWRKSWPRKHWWWIKEWNSLRFSCLHIFIILGTFFIDSHFVNYHHSHQKIDYQDHKKYIIYIICMLFDDGILHVHAKQNMMMPNFKPSKTTIFTNQRRI